MKRNSKLKNFNETIRTQYEWIDLLDSLSPSIAKIQLKPGVGKDGHYAYNDQGKVIFLNSLAYDFANSVKHNKLIVSAAESLLENNIASSDVVALLSRLVSKKTSNTYGAFCELVGYEWLIRHGLKFSIQVDLSGADVIGKNGSTLDGQLELLISKAFFDIKAFGFHTHIINCLRKRLESEMPDFRVMIEGCWDVSIDYLESISDGEEFESLKIELRDKGIAKRSSLDIQLKIPETIEVSSHLINPYKLAEMNAKYPYRFSRQFTCNEPFILFFIIHPWFSQNFLSGNFSNNRTIFTRAFARRVFMQFSNDNSILSDVEITISEAANLLSGMVFLNVWPLETLSSPTAWIYLNPRAKNLLVQHDFSIIPEAQKKIVFEDFCCDNY